MPYKIPRNLYPQRYGKYKPGDYEFDVPANCSIFVKNKKAVGILIKTNDVVCIIHYNQRHYGG